MKKTNIPKTKKECFAILDEMLSEEEKVIVVKGEEDSHFSLGLWIRNNWFYTQSDDAVKVLLKNFGEHLIIFDTDYNSGVIIDSYRKYLKRKKKLEKGDD